MLEKLQSIKNCLIKISVFSSCSVHAVKVSGFVDGGGRGVLGFVVVSVLQELFHIFNNNLL